jgi:hypothetical protein
VWLPVKTAFFVNGGVTLNAVSSGGSEMTMESTECASMCAGLLSRTVGVGVRSKERQAVKQE